ncbi:MAG: hypothetical protein QXZ20_02985 [Candidatus Aenigmatarchaeota archaeon]
MINVEFSTFLCFLLSGWILFISILEYLSSRRIINSEKKVYFEKRICEICREPNLLVSSGKYWRCFYCNSLNKK